MGYSPAIEAILRRLNPTGTFDPDYNLGVENLASQATIAEGEDTVAKSRLNEDYGTNRGRLDRQRKRDVEGLRDAMAAQNNIQSGAYLKAQGELGEDYQDKYTDLSRALSRGTSDTDRGAANRSEGYGMVVKNLMRAKAQRDEQRAKEEAERRARLDAYGRV